jgi:alkyl hydroperoxide reductase subunit D
MSWVDQIKEGLPEYAKDTKLNLDSVINRSTLNLVEANACALAAAMATGNGKLVTFIQSNIADATERDAALTASSLMGMNNVWYPYIEMTDDPNLKGLPAQLRMNAISTHGGTTKERFES